MVIEPGLGAERWQRTWDAQQETYLPYREEAFTALLDAVLAVPVGTDAPRVLDLAGGTGSLSARLLRRVPAAEATLLDVDPVLLEIARASLPSPVTVLRGDLTDSGWVEALPHRSYHAVLTTTAMHCFPPDRLRALYGEIRGVLAPGGVFCNADRMADDGLPRFTAGLVAATKRADGPTWDQWWAEIAADPALGPLVVAGDGGSADWYPPVSWHLAALGDAGFAETGTLWRRADQAAVVGVAS